MWLIDFHLHSFSYNSISKWRKLFLRSAVRPHPQGWNDPLPWWVLWMDTQEVTPCLLHHQEACPSLLSRLVPRVHPTCPLICPPCPWGHLPLMAYDYVMVPRPLKPNWCLLLCAEHSFSGKFFYICSVYGCVGLPRWSHCSVWRCWWWRDALRILIL